MDRWSNRAVFLAVVLPLFVIYLLTSTYSRPIHIDALTNTLAAWDIAQDGNPTLDEYEQLAQPIYRGNVGWVVQAKDGVAAQYPPGAALHAVPLYAVWPEEPELTLVTGGVRPAPPVEILLPPLAPAAITASAAVAVAMGLLGLAFRRYVPATYAILGAYVMGLGTSAWSVAADALWQHGPGMLWIAAGGLLASGSYWGSGLAYGMAVLVRPPTAVIAAATGIGVAWAKRSLVPAVKIAVGSGLGLAAIVAYNAWVFGNPSISGGYGGGFRDRTVGGGLGYYVQNIWGALFDPTRGLLIWAPFLIPLILGLRYAWRRAEAPVRASAVGGVLYFLLQLKANKFSGGGGFSTYRYPLEVLAAAAPLLMISYWEWVRHQWLMHRVLILGVAFGVATQTVFAIAT